MAGDEQSKFASGQYASRPLRKATTPMSTRYTKEFFDERHDSVRSARVIVPLVLEHVKPQSVLDVGCGTGAFLAVFREHGVSEIFGVDGPWVPKEQRLTTPVSFMERNLEDPFDLKRTFDLVISLEVGEHLPAQAADGFVKNLARHGDVVLFSAAIPGQGGSHHVNEQWPAYWIERFKREGYLAVDCLRGQLWNNPEVSFWYAQNAMFFVRSEALPRYPRLDKAYSEARSEALPLVHPVLFQAKARRAQRYDSFINRLPFRIRKHFQQ